MDLNKAYLIDVVDGLKQLSNSSADIIIVDPPYNFGKDFGVNKDNLELSDYLSWCDTWINECIRILKDSGTMFIYGFSEMLANISARLPLEKRWLIWHYTNRTIPKSNFWQRSHESIIVSWKDRDKRIFNKDDVREPYTDIFLENSVGRARTTTKGRFQKNDKETVYEAHKNGALPRDVIKIPALAGGAGKVERWFFCKDCLSTYFPEEIENHLECEIVKHPTQKPLALGSRLINSCKPKEGGLVVIPFIGSGSEAVAAEMAGMDFIGFDNNKDFVDMTNYLMKRRQNIGLIFEWVLENVSKELKQGE